MELPPDARAGYERTVADLRARLGDAAFADTWAAGQALPVDQAAAEAEALAAELAAELAADPVAAPAGLAAPAAAALPAGVSEREIEVLRLLAQGLTNAQIGERLFISPRTVNAHLYRIYNKLGLTSRSAAVRYVFDHGLA
jgi:DNA-binding NarL/FixJ family response regulator